MFHYNHCQLRRIEPKQKKKNTKNLTSFYMIKRIRAR